MTLARPQPARLEPAATRGLRAILGASAVSMIGDGAFVAAAPLAAAAITRDPAAVALVTAAETLPWLVIAPLAGVYVDRWPRRTTMIAADTLRALAVGALAMIIAVGVASIAAISVCAFLIVSGMVFHSAASEAVIADLTHRDEHALHSVNGRLQSISTAGRQLLGPPAGSWAFAIAAWLPFAADAVSFLASAVLLRLTPRAKALSQREGRAGIFASMREGAAYLVHHRQLRLLAVLTGAANLSLNAGLATLVLFATDNTGLAISAARYGLLLAAMAAGGFLAGLCAPHVLKMIGTRTTFVGGMLAECVAWLLIVLLANALVSAIALAIIGATVALKSIVIMASRQRQVSSEMLGRVISAYRVIGNGAAPLGALLGGVVGAAWGLEAPMLLAAIILPIAAGLAIPALRTP
jgi:MFS family permease